MTAGQQLLTEWLGRSGLKQFELADLVSITKAYLSQVLSGKRRPSLPIAVRIETHTGVPVKSWVTTARGNSDKPRKRSSKTPTVVGVQTDHADT